MLRVATRNQDYNSGSSENHIILHKHWLTRFNEFVEKIVKEAFRNYKEANNTELIEMEQLENVENVDLLLQAVNKMIESEKNWAFNIARSVMNQSLVEGEKQKYNSSIGRVNTTDFISEELEGEVVLDKNNCVIYLSAFRSVIAQQKIKSFSI